MTETRFPLNKEFIAERDLQIFKERSKGSSHQDIAKKFSISTRAVGEALRRQLTKMNREALASYPEVLGLELERLDLLQKAVWSLTQYHQEVLPDNTTVVIPPDLRAVDTALKIMAHRAKLMGIDTHAQKVDVSVSGTTEVRHTLHGATAAHTREIDYREETRNLLELMMNANAIDPEVGKQLLAAIDKEQGIIEATIVEPQALPEGRNDGEATEERATEAANSDS